MTRAPSAIASRLSPVGFVLASAVACFDPDLVEGLPCDSDDDCPAAQDCREGQCLSPGQDPIPHDAGGPGPDDDAGDAGDDGDAGSPPGRTRSWTKLTPDTQPPDRHGHAMAPAGASDLILFGGQAESITPTNRDDTWRWDGEDWNSLEDDSGTPPDARHGHALAPRKGGANIVLFGGTDDTVESPFDDTWSFEERWSDENPDGGPDARAHHALARGPESGEVLLFGGEEPDTTFTSYLADTWSFDGDDWERVVSDSAPPARAHHAMAYDSQNAEVVLFGGHDEDDRLGDTWIFDGEWERAAPDGPSPEAREGAILVYDAEGEETILFGGTGDDGDPLGDTWAWDGERWEEITNPEGSPPPRAGAAAAFDPGAGEIVLFGGRGGGQDLRDTWILEEESAAP